MDIASQILYEDNHLIALNKLVGQIVQSDKTGDLCLCDMLKDFIKVRDHKPGNVFCGVIHRLDRPVSGVVLFAKTSKALARMNEQVKNRTLKKTYWAACKNNPPVLQGHLEDWILRDEAKNKSFVVQPKGNIRDGIDARGARLASLDFVEKGCSHGGYHLLEIDLHTGRHHQIRCQLAHMGCPIKGDLKYGAQHSNPDGGISLHSRRVAFQHPVSHQLIVIEAPAPVIFSSLESDDPQPSHCKNLDPNDTNFVVEN